MGNQPKQHPFERGMPYLQELVRAAAAEAGPEIGDLLAVSKVMDRVNAVLRGQGSIAETDPDAPHVWLLLKQLARFPRCDDHQGSTMIPHVHQGMVRYAHRLPSGRLCYGRSGSRLTYDAQSRTEELAEDTPKRLVVHLCEPDASRMGRVQVFVMWGTGPDVRPTVALDIVVPVRP